MAVLDRDALGESPLADLHVIAGELGVDGFRRLRKADLIDAIVARQGGEPSGDAGDEPEAEAPAAEEPEGDEPAPERPPRRRRSRSRASAAPAEEEGATDEGSDPEPAAETPDSIEGTVEVLGNGSAFVRIKDGEQSDGDVYVSPAQVRRTELKSGDVVSGPVRSPRRSERHPSLARVDTINGRSADEVQPPPAEKGGDATPNWDELPAELPSQRFALGGGPGGPEEPTLKAIEWLTPFGRGSRVVLAGPPHAGKSEALRRLAGALAAHDDVEVSVVLAGVRPEEITEWKEGPVKPVAALSFAASPDAQAQAIDRAVEAGRRTAARGGHAVVLVDTLAHIAPGAARKILSQARAVRDGGSLTVIATAGQPVGGETTVIALDVALAATRVFPAIDLPRSGTLRPERLVGEDGAEAIAKARVEAAKA